MSAHTPGPWTVRGEPEDREVWALHKGECITFLAVHADPDHELANARLIAAAPELLEALDRLLRELPEPEAGWCSDGEIEACGHPDCHAKASAEAAIRAARGES